MFAFWYRYWPVGQGVFATGKLFDRNRQPFVWVYDCGTLSDRRLLDKAIESFTREWLLPARRRIDLLTLSHFDRDHVDGVVQLLGRCEVDTLVLPYLPLWRRLLLASKVGAEAGGDLFRFLIDPVGFLLSAAGPERIGRIVLVPASEPPDAPTSPVGPDDPDGRGPELFREGPVKLDIDAGTTPDDADGDPALPQVDGRDVVFLKPGGRLLLRNLWEFVPYNDAMMLPKVDLKFREQARLLSANLLQAVTDQGRTAALGALRDAYDGQFGRSSIRRNIISLFLYSGPAADVELLEVTTCSNVPVPFDRKRFGQLFCGDGYLNTIKRSEALRRYLTDLRMRQCGFLQVAHHGSRRSWRPDLADDLDPVVSIFCADPTRLPQCHPHHDVFHDFRNRSPVLVDAANRLDVLGIFRR